MKKIAADRNYKVASGPCRREMSRRAAGVANVGEIIVFNLTESLASMNALSPEVKSQLSDIRLNIQFALNAANTLIDSV
jgi:hypothetical protein